MNPYLNELQEDFGDWGTVFSVQNILSQDPSPFKRLVDKGFSMINSRIVFSVCPDDINRLHDRDTMENKIKEQFGEEFHLGNLAAYPIGGVSGITAASHHPPDTVIENAHHQGNLIFFISAHTGLTILEDETRYGYVLRPGQDKFTTSCGAMMGFLKSIRHVTKLSEFKKVQNDPLDPCKTVLFKELLDNYKEEIIERLHSQDLNQTIIQLTKINYQLIMDKFKAMLTAFLEKEKFEGEYAIIGGITVNTEKEDYFIFRDYALNSLP